MYILTRAGLLCTLCYETPLKIINGIQPCAAVLAGGEDSQGKYRFTDRLSRDASPLPNVAVELLLVISKEINWAILAFKMAPRVSSLTPIVMPLTMLLT